MHDGHVAAYVLTTGSPRLLGRTLASVSWASRAEVVRLPDDPRGLSAREIACSAAGDDCWVLVLVEGEVLDEGSLRAALATGSPRRTPSTAGIGSIAPDALSLPGPRLFAPGESSSGAGQQAGSPSETSPGAREWVLTQPLLTERVADEASVRWACAAAVALTRRQALEGIGDHEFLWLGELLLLAGERDAVITRWRASLDRNLSWELRRRWAMLGLAASVTGIRAVEADDLCRSWAAYASESDTPLLAWWAAIASENVQQAPETALSWRASAQAASRGGLVADPWFPYSRMVRGEAHAGAYATSARAVLASWPSTSTELMTLLQAWRMADLPVAELVDRWPAEAFDVLLMTVAGDTMQHARWRLELADEVYRRQGNPLVLGLAARLAARLGLEQAVTWTQRVVEAGVPFESALALRAADRLLPVRERVAAACCWWAVRGEEELAVLEEAVSAAHGDDVAGVLEVVDAVAPQALPLVIGLLCQDTSRVPALQAALRSFGADEQADALGTLITLSDDDQAPSLVHSPT